MGACYSKPKLIEELAQETLQEPADEVWSSLPSRLVLRGVGYRSVVRMRGEVWAARRALLMANSPGLARGRMRTRAHLAGLPGARYGAAQHDDTPTWITDNQATED